MNLDYESTITEYSPNLLVIPIICALDGYLNFSSFNVLDRSFIPYSYKFFFAFNYQKL